MTVDPKDLRAGQRIDLVTAGGVRIENLPLRESLSDCLHSGDLTVGLMVRTMDGLLGVGITVTAIRSQPDPELWLDAAGLVWQRAEDGYYSKAGTVTSDQILLSSLQAARGPLRRLTIGEPESEAS